jgi:hypothetical protein
MRRWPSADLNRGLELGVADTIASDVPDQLGKQADVGESLGIEIDSAVAEVRLRERDVAR